MGDSGAARGDLNRHRSRGTCLLPFARVDLAGLAGRAAQARPGDKRFQDRRQHGAIGAEASVQPTSPQNVVPPRPVRAKRFRRRRLRGSAEVIGLIYGDKVAEGGVELRRRRRVYRQQLVIDREAGESPLPVGGVEKTVGRFGSGAAGNGFATAAIRLA